VKATEAIACISALPVAIEIVVRAEIAYRIAIIAAAPHRLLAPFRIVPRLSILLVTALDIVRPV